jgi:hypothetical protein
VYAEGFKPVGFLQGRLARRAAVAREDWTLLAVGASDGLLPIQLQKSLFLLGQRFPELKATGFYEFRPVGGGDFSEQIYTDAEALGKKDLISVRFSDGAGGREYRLTPAGARRARKLEEQLRPELRQALRKLVSWVTTRTMDQLLRGSRDATGPIRPGSIGHASVRPH